MAARRRVRGVPNPVGDGAMRPRYARNLAISPGIATTSFRRDLLVHRYRGGVQLGRGVFRVLHRL